MRLKYLDVLKCLAIIAVVLYHSGFLTFGYLGVDLFLVINGYLITKGLYRKILTAPATVATNTINYLSFEVSRVVRLLPVLLVAGLVCMVLGYFLMLPDDYENLSQSVIATNFFGNNILAAITTANYWDVVNEYKPLMHTWYVGLVMQFYIVYPILFYIARLDKKKPQRTLLIMISALALLSLLVYFVTTDDAQRFYYLPSRFFEFAAGGVIALTWKQYEWIKTYNQVFAYICYALLIALMAVNEAFIPSNIRLVVVVALSVVLITSCVELENGLTGNRIIAKIGAASYSLFVWHQVLLAFYRYSISSEFTVISYALLIVVIGVSSWITYQYIEQKTSIWLKEKRQKIILYTSIVFMFLSLSTFAAYIYLHAGVVRDVPELYISKSNIHRGLHNEYNDKIFQLDKSFSTNKRHWLVIGNSFGRDFANVIIESPVADSVEVSYIELSKFKESKYNERFANADCIFVSSRGLEEKNVMDIEKKCTENSFPVEKIVIVGEKVFGESNGHFYVRRNNPDYFSLRTDVSDEVLMKNRKFSSKYGDRFLDLLALVIDNKESVPVFTPDHHFISQDCRHFSKGGAVYFGQLIEWDNFLKY